MCIGTLALTGFPMFAVTSQGRDLESAYASHNTFAIYGFVMTVARRC